MDYWEGLADGGVGDVVLGRDPVLFGSHIVERCLNLDLYFSPVTGGPQLASTRLMF